MHYVLVTGFRYWDQPSEVTKRLDELYARHYGDIMVIHGDCSTKANSKYPGGVSVDELTKSWAIIREVPYLSFPARWQSEGKAAGPRRNGYMTDWLSTLLSDLHHAKYGYSNVDPSRYTCLAFVHPDSVGTLDCMKKMKEHGLEYETIHWKDPNALQS